MSPRTPALDKPAPLSERFGVFGLDRVPLAKADLAFTLLSVDLHSVSFGAVEALVGRDVSSRDEVDVGNLGGD